MNNTPKIFISSTVYDFKDIRSALKFYLEEHGYIVYTSESSDFKVDVKVHSYEACLNLIDECDYFILLIGSRVGGWYDKENKISITRQEYRHAYQLHQQGGLQILSFVRNEVWQLKETRNELTRYLENINNFDKDLIADIVNAPTKFANDAQFVSDFIQEVGKNAETRIAMQDKALLPTGNWIRVFNSFKDIIDSLKELIKINDLDYKLNLEILKNELQAYNLQVNEILRNYPNALYVTLNNLLNNAKKSESPYGEFILDKDDWETFIPIFWYTSVIHYIPIDVQVINQILTSKTFFNFNSQNQSFTKSPIYENLLELKKGIYAFNNQNFDISEVIQLTNEMKRKFKIYGNYRINTTDLTKVVSRAGIISNIFNLTYSINNSIETGVYQSPQIFDFNVFALKIIESLNER
jgi:hypothetical protein